MVDSTINLGGTFTVPGLGTLVRTGGTVNVIGTLDNTGTTLDLDAERRRPGIINGGTDPQRHRRHVTGGADVHSVRATTRPTRLNGCTINGDVRP